MQVRLTEDSECSFSQLPTPRAQEPGSTSPGYGDSLNDVANRFANGYAPKDLDEHGLLRTPGVVNGTGGAISETAARERGRMVQVQDQVAELAYRNGLKVSPAIEAQLMPTPTLGHIRNYDEPIEDYLDRREKADSGEYRGMPGISLGVAVRMETLPTPTTMDAKATNTPEVVDKFINQGKQNCLTYEIVQQVFPTPTTRDYKDGQSPHERDGEVQTDTVARAIFNSGEVTQTNWGKFEPAIRRWEQLTRPAPAPTLPDGKDGAHRLSSKFTEWMMGLPDGWITGHGLKRNDELKMAGNGVVPQQAELALRMLLGADIPKEVDKGTLFPTPTVSDTFTDSLKSSQQKPGSMHSVTLPQAVMWTVGVELEKATSESL